MSKSYSLAQEPSLLAKKVIKDHHPHLLRCEIRFLFQQQVDKNGQPMMIQAKGRFEYGAAKVVSGLNAYLAGDDEEDPHSFFVILITKYSWDHMTPQQKAALVDHELSHCEYDGESGRYSMRGHDVEEFHEIIKRHGAWNEQLDIFFKAGKQLKLTYMEAVESQPEQPKAAADVDGGDDGAASKKNRKAKAAKKAPTKRRPDHLQPVS